MTESPFINEFIALGEARGRAEEVRSLVLRLGAKRFGLVPPTIEAAVRAITDTDQERLKRISDRILEATDWNDLLGTP
jgi:hypothetical protein